jgi:corrinoid protein of di/trimethylamine methyltransferase
MSDEILIQLMNSVIEGDPEATMQLTQQALSKGIEPMTIINGGLMLGMNVVGDKFASGEYYLPDLIIAADGMQKAMEFLEPELRARQQTVEVAGIVLLGTVKGDIHEIGKSLVGTMLAANGFKVHDLGVDVPTDTFIVKAKEIKPNIIGLSALLTTTMTVQKEIVDALTEAGIRSQLKVMVGGAPVTRSWSEDIGADGYAEDAMGAVMVAKKLMGK